MSMYLQVEQLIASATAVNWEDMQASMCAASVAS